MNPGKLFEEDFKNSAPDWLYVYRLKDCPAWSPGEGSSRRFTPSNDYDFFVYDKFERAAYALELKSVKGKSIRFDALRPNQILGLVRAYDGGLDAGVLVEFRGVGEAWYIPIRGWTFLANEEGAKKSINVDEVRNGTWAVRMPGAKKVTRWKWDVSTLLETVI